MHLYPRIKVHCRRTKTSCYAVCVTLFTDSPQILTWFLPDVLVMDLCAMPAVGVVQSRDPSFVSRSTTADWAVMHSICLDSQVWSGSGRYNSCGSNYYIRSAGVVFEPRGRCLDLGICHWWSYHIIRVMQHLSCHLTFLSFLISCFLEKCSSTCVSNMPCPHDSSFERFVNGCDDVTFAINIFECVQTITLSVRLACLWLWNCTAHARR